MTEWKDCSETPSASCSGILGRNQITHSLSRTLSSLAVYEGGLLAPFRLVEEKGEERGGEAWRGLVTASNSFEVARDRFPPPPRTVDSNCFCPGVDRVEQFPLLRGTPGVRRASGTGNRWLWHSVASNSWNLTRFWDRFDKFIRPIDAISAENFVDDILQVGVMEGGKYVNEKEKSRWGKYMW